MHENNEKYKSQSQSMFLGQNPDYLSPKLKYSANYKNN